MQQHSSWQASDENTDKWYNGKISVKERHILINHWIVAAYRKISSPEYQLFSWKMFEKSRLRITADGFDDDKIKPEDDPEYYVPPSYIYIEATSALPEEPTVEPADEPEDLQVLEDVTDVSDKE